MTREKGILCCFLPWSCSLKHERTIILLSKEKRSWASHRGQICFPFAGFFLNCKYFCLSIYKFFSINLWGRIFFQLWVARLFILFTRPPAESINQEINEPSYEMVGVKITVTNYGHFFSCWFFIFFSDNSKCFHRNGFEMHILIILYTVCTCDTLVPTRILKSEISWFCFDFPKWGPVSFIITDFNVFV